jgi:hypothetical protein
MITLDEEGDNREHAGDGKHTPSVKFGRATCLGAVDASFYSCQKFITVK